MGLMQSMVSLPIKEGEEDSFWDSSCLTASWVDEKEDLFIPTFDFWGFCIKAILLFIFYSSSRPPLLLRKSLLCNKRRSPCVEPSGFCTRRVRKEHIQETEIVCESRSKEYIIKTSFSLLRIQYFSSQVW